MLYVAVFYGWIVIGNKELLKELYSNCTFSHATIADDHQLHRGQVFVRWSGHSASFARYTARRHLVRTRYATHVEIRAETESTSLPETLAS